MNKLILLLAIALIIPAVHAEDTYTCVGEYLALTTCEDGNNNCVNQPTVDCDYGCEETPNGARCATPDTSDVTCADLDLPEPTCTTGRCTRSDVSLSTAIESSQGTYTAQFVWDGITLVEQPEDLTLEVRTYATQEPETCTESTTSFNTGSSSSQEELTCEPSIPQGRSSMALVAYAQTEGGEQAASCITIKQPTSCSYEEQECQEGWDNKGLLCDYGASGQYTTGHCCPEGTNWNGDSCVQPEEATRETYLEETNVIVDEQRSTVHLCGTHWSVEEEFITEHELCSQVSIEQTIGTQVFTCAVGEDGWSWYAQSQGSIPPMPESQAIPQMVPGTQAWENLVSGLQRADENIPQQAIACSNQQAVPANLKDGIPPLREQAYCSPQQCALVTQETAQCVPVGYEHQGYVCEEQDYEFRGRNLRQVQWSAKITALAQEMRSLAPGEKIMINCGPQSTVLNKQSSEQHGYCQLSVFDDDVIETSVVGVVFDSEEDNQAIQAFTDELNASHPQDELDPLSFEEQAQHDYYAFTHAQLEGIQVPIGYFTDADSLSSVEGTGFWDWFSDLFRNQQSSPIPATSAQQFYYDTLDGEDSEYFVAVEYVRDSECADNKVIVHADGQTCYDEQLYRRMIQRR